MAPTETELPFVFVRISLLTVVILFGVSGNLAAIFVHLKTFKTNKLNGLAYLHLAIMDLMLCLVHASVGLILECLGLVHPFYGYGPILSFFEERVALLIYKMAIPLSVLGLTFIATVRCWRVFNPFGRAKNGRLMALIFMADLIVIVTILYLDFPVSATYSMTKLNSTTIPDKNTSTEWLVHETLSATCATGTNCGKARERNMNEVTTSVMRFEFALVNATPPATSPNMSESTWTDIGRSGSKLTFRNRVFIVGLGIVLLFLIILCYILISTKLFVEFRRVTSEDFQKREFLHRQVKHFATHALLIITMMVTLIPAAFVAIQNSSDNFALRRLVSTISLMNSLLNPYLYCLLTTVNRSRLRKVFTFQISFSRASNNQ